MNYKDALKKYRTEVIGMSTRELGEELGIDGSYIRQVESGAVMPSLRYLAQLNELGMSIDAMFAHTDLKEILLKA